MLVLDAQNTQQTKSKTMSLSLCLCLGGHVYMFWWPFPIFSKHLICRTHVVRHGVVHFRGRHIVRVLLCYGASMKFPNLLQTPSAKGKSSPLHLSLNDCCGLLIPPPQTHSTHIYKYINLIKLHFTH